MTIARLTLQVRPKIGFYAPPDEYAFALLYFTGSKRLIPLTTAFRIVTV